LLDNSLDISDENYQVS